MIQAVLFDLGGTLHVCSTTEERKIWFARRLISRLSEYGISVDISPEEMSRMLGINAEIYKHDVEGSLRELPPETVWTDYYLRDLHLDRETLAPISEELHGMGIRLGLISNILSRTIIPHFVAEYGLTDYFECVLSSAGTGIRKPDPAIFRLAEQQMHLQPEEMAYVGDTLSRDVRGVRNAGWRLAIQIYSPTAAKRDKGLAELGVHPDYNITDLSEIPGIIRTENTRC